VRTYLLDTDVISEVRKHRPHGAVLTWLSRLGSEQILLSAVSIGELQNGVELTRRQDPQKAKEIESWIDLVEISFRVLPVDGKAFRECARLMRRRPGHLLQDAMIAASARVNDLTVATRNESDFRIFEVAVFNPFKSVS